jgi:hypothetical protein
MRVSPYGVPVPTIRQLVRYGHDVATWCKACNRPGRMLVAEDLAAMLGEDFSLADLDRLLRCSRCGRKGQVDTRVHVRSNRRASGWESAVLPRVGELIARVMVERNPDLEAKAPELADAIVRTLYRAGYL